MSLFAGLPTLLGGLLISVSLLGPAFAQGEEEKTGAREEILALIGDGDWRGADKALKAYKRKYGKTPEGKEEVSRLTALLKGSKDLEEIQEDYRKKPRPLTAVVKLQRLLGKYSKAPEFVEKARELIDVFRSEYVLVLEDFEDWKLEDKSDAAEILRRALKVRRGLTLIEDPKLVKHGEFSCQWESRGIERSLTMESPQEDLSEYAFFCAWIYSPEKLKRPGRIQITASTDTEHYFTYALTIDWAGWKEIRMPIEGRRSAFSRHGKAEWDSITSFSFTRNYDSTTKLRIIVDDIRMEKAAK